MGGVVEAKPLPLIIPPNSKQGIFLCSDLHLGSRTTDYGLIRQDLKQAMDRGDRILLGGDVVDGIFPGDSRFAPSKNLPSITQRDDMANATVEWVAQFLSPFALFIDGVGVGNHETAVLKRKSVDLGREIWGWLYQLGSPAEFLGYTAFIHYTVKRSEDSRGGRPFTIWYTHGSGRVASEGAALTRLQSQSQNFDADAYWSGHYHHKVVSQSEKITSSGPRPVTYVLTGAYQNAYRSQTQQSVKKDGWLNNYASEAGLKPQGRGGVRLVICTGSRGEIERVRVEQ